MMSKFVYRIAGLFICIAAYSHTAMALDINVVHSGSWPPYADESLPEQGLAIDLVTTALKRSGYSPQVKTASLPQILEGSKTGIYDVFATPWYTMDRAQYLDFSQPYLESSINFIKRTDTSFEYASFDNLEGMTVGVIENYAYDEDFSNATAIEKISASSLTENLRKLVEKKIDLTLDDERVLRYTLNRSMPRSTATLEILAKPLAVRGINIGVSRKNPEHAKIVAIFNKAIAEMKNDGTYDSIIQKHKDYIEHPMKRQEPAP
ncbi:MAG TPA: amino acid ABC transporter amino acid-binding protein [Gammaproteobacteria bacterium]|nr:amino acid ABC transporter amino acid-binding protein [Gammaproteobacteria bacterium]